MYEVPGYFKPIVAVATKVQFNEKNLELLAGRILSGRCVSMYAVALLLAIDAANPGLLTGKSRDELSSLRLDLRLGQ